MDNNVLGFEVQCDSAISFSLQPRSYRDLQQSVFLNPESLTHADNVRELRRFIVAEVDPCSVRFAAEAIQSIWEASQATRGLVKPSNRKQAN